MSKNKNIEYIKESMARLETAVNKGNQYAVTSEKWFLVGYLACLLLNELITAEDYDDFCERMQNINQIKGDRKCQQAP